MKATFHAETSERRDGDMIWRIPRRDGGDAYLMLLPEFQSSPNPWMALRALVHAGLLRQHLVKEQRLPPDGRLPPILPIVLYNGDRRWVATLALHALIGLPENSLLWRWQPDMRDHMNDEGPFREADVEQRDALPALLFRLESRPIWSRLLPSPTRRWLGSCATWGLRRCGPSLPNCSAASWGRSLRSFGCHRSCWRYGIYWRHGLRTESSNGCRRASRKAVGRAKRPCCCACWSAGSVRFPAGPKIASPPPTPSRWRNGGRASSTPEALTTYWHRAPPGQRHMTGRPPRILQTFVPPPHHISADPQTRPKRPTSRLRSR